MKRLRYKLSAALLPVVILPLLALGFQGMLQLNNSSQENLRSQVALLASNSHLHLNEMIRNYRLNLLAIPESDSMARYLTSQDPQEKGNYHAPRVLRIFHQLQVQNPGIAQIALIDSEDVELLKTGQNIDPFSSLSVANRQFLSVMHQQPERFYEHFIYATELEQFVLKLGLKFNSYHPELARYDREPEQYTLIMTLSLRQLGEYLKEQERLYGFQLQLIERHSHQLIYTTDPALVRTPEEESLSSPATQLTSYHLERSPINDDLELVAWIPEKMIASASAKIRTSLIVWLLLSLAVLLLLSSWILRRLIISPMEKLRRLMRQVARQELHHIPMLPVVDEMTELHNQFSSMLSRLEISQQELEQSAYTDPVTGLENRIAFLRQLHKQLNLSRPQRQPFSLILIKMHNLSSINNTFGTRTGDLALLAMTRILLSLNSNASEEGISCHLARIGSDEFAFLLPPQCAGQKQPVALCEQLARELDSPLQIGEYQLKLRFSGGIVSYPEAGEQVEELMQSLSQARHQAGRYTGSYWYQLDGASATQLRENKWLESELGQAIERQQLRVVFQPQYTIEDRSICGAEVLLRWNHPEFGMVPPDRFIPIAEHSSQILEIDLWVLEQSCHFLAKLHEAGIHIHLAVNASATELSNPCYPQHVTELLCRYNLPATALSIEITETALVELDDVAHDMVRRLKELGIIIALDDFGTGYTSLKHLAELPLDILKIDRSFTQQIGEDPTMIDSILQLANAFKLQVVAEGVETESQLTALHSRGCQMAQGYLLSRPIEAEALWLLLQEQKTPTVISLREQTP